MIPEIQLTAKEQQVLQIYRDSSMSGIGRAVRQSLGYAASAGVFLCLAISYDEPLYAIGIYAIFVLQLGVRILVARRIAGVMPKILCRYEDHISGLQNHLEKVSSNDRNS
jgi:hypothetical protein